MKYSLHSGWFIEGWKGNASFAWLFKPIHTAITNAVYGTYILHVHVHVLEYNWFINQSAH